MPKEEDEKIGCSMWALNSMVLATMFALGVLLLLYFMDGCSEVNRKIGLPDDNVAEEILEQQIENKLGFDIDLTPQTPERYGMRYGDKA